ncbi:MAG: pentapeptide repeat-containing protein [Thermoleophilia bacterium]
MADDQHLKLAASGAAAWNQWRRENESATPDLSGAGLAGADLEGAILAFASLFAADLAGARLARADFNSANLMYAGLTAADLEGADFRQANLFAADLSRARLKGSRFSGAHASGVKLRDADLEGANLFVADLSHADLRGARLGQANFFGSLLNDADLSGADCRETDLSGADLSRARLADVDFTGATLTDCKVPGVIATGLKLDGASQNDLVLTVSSLPEITVDGLDAALLLAPLVSGGESTVDRLPGGDAILLLGAYPHERKAFLNALRDEIRQAGFIPVYADLAENGSNSLAETLLGLARPCRLALVDLGGMEQLPGELQPMFAAASLPLQPLLAGAASAGVTTGLAGLAGTANLRPLFQTEDAAMMIMALGPKVLSTLP